MCMYMYVHIYSYKSADPGLSQGRGGAWDHRRCGTTALSKATQACRVAQTLPGSVHKLLKPHHSASRAQGCRLPSIKTPKPFPRPLTSQSSHRIVLACLQTPMKAQPSPQTLPGSATAACF